MKITSVPNTDNKEKIKRTNRFFIEKNENDYINRKEKVENDVRVFKLKS